MQASPDSIRDESPGANKERYRRFYQGFVIGKDPAIVDELVAPDVLSHSPLPGQAPGAEGLKATMALFHAAFPDLAAEVIQLLAEADKVMGHFKVSGSHQGEFMGLAPTGKAFSYEEVVIVRFTAGRIVEHWAVADTQAMMQALGQA